MNVAVMLTALGVISVAGWLPLPIGIASLSFLACFIRPQWKAGLWMWVVAAALTTVGAMTTPDTSPMELLQIGPARPRNLLMQAALAGTFVNALAYRQQDPRRSALLVMIGIIVTATGITNTFSLSGKITATILPLITGLLLSINNICLKPTWKTLRWQLIGCIAFVLTFAASTAIITAKKDFLYELGNRMLDARPPMSAGSRGIEQPQLGPTYGDPGSTARVLQVQAQTPLYLRQATFTSYLSGTWGPPLTFRRMAPLPIKYVIGPDPDAITIQRYDATDRVVYLPAETTSLVAETNSNFAWAQDDNGPIITGPDAPSEYAFTVANSTEVNREDLPLGADSDSQQDASLDVPDDLVGPLERFILRNNIDAGYTIDTAQAIVAALQREHEYSLTFSPNPGDALASFLDSPGDGAHCAYFASATVMLLRHLGYPARLVSGFYAHEPSGNGITVRGRDAHAWVEVLVPQKGWVLIEATPATGIPAGDQSSVSWFSRLWERIVDSIRTMRTELENGNITFIAIPSVFVALLLGWSFYARRKQRQSFVTTDRVFSDFVREYNRICRKMELPKVGNETLMHHFKTHVNDFDIDIRLELSEQLENYERCRYGTGRMDEIRVAELRRTYHRLRKR